MARLDTTTTTLAVAAKALAIFKDQYPNRISIWIETSSASSLNVKIKSISRGADDEELSKPMAEHIYFNETQALMEV